MLSDVSEEILTFAGYPKAVWRGSGRTHTSDLTGRSDGALMWCVASPLARRSSDWSVRCLPNKTPSG